MSAIDTLTHAHVGYFCDLPIYWVFEEGKLGSLTDQSNDYEKVINQYYLSIGGGSGEHPALIIKNDAVIYHFMKSIEEIEEAEIDANESDKFDYDMFLLSEKIQNKILDRDNDYKDVKEEICEWMIDKNQWPLNTFVNVAKVYESVDEDLETIIMNAMALFIITEMPLEKVVQDEDLLEFAKMVKSYRWNKAFKHEMMAQTFKGFKGVLNCQKYGKIIRDSKVIWGYSLSDWMNDQK